MSTPPPSPPPASDPSDEGLAALERLRGRIEAAVAEIERLREENAALSDRVQELATHDVAGGNDAAGLTLEGDPETLRKQVEGFIEAIDRMLVVPKTPGEDAPSESTG
jgi:uncharacterized protein (UPF0335 family)